MQFMSCNSCDAERSNACHRSARGEHAVRGVDLRLTIQEFSPPARPKIKSLAKPCSARLASAARSRPSLSLFARHGDQAPTVRTEPAPPPPALGRHPAQYLLSSSTGRPSPSNRTPLHGRQLDDKSNLGWAVTRHPSRILTYPHGPPSRILTYPHGPPHSR